MPAPPPPDAQPPRALLSKPLPLVHPEQQLGLVFAAKSGCTYAVKWFFHQAGCLEEALAHGPWVHDYRRRVFSQTPGYEQRLAALLTPSARIIRVVRNPYARAVSTYLHVVRYGYELDRASAFFGRPLGVGAGVTFREWVRYLENEDLRNCNVHHRLQAHEAELTGLIQPTVVIRLEDGGEPFQVLEREWDLPPADHARLRSSVHHTRRQKGAVEFCGDTELAVGPNYTGELPPNDAFYDDDLRQRIAALYAEDFQRYGYA